MLKFDETFFVGLSVILFTLLIIKPLLKFVNKGLDERAKNISLNIKEAEKIASHAEKLLSEYMQKQTLLKKEVEQLFIDTKEQIRALTEEAEKNLADSLKHKSEAAMQRISQYEANVIDEVRRQAVEVAIVAVRSIIKERLELKDSEAIIDSLIDDISSRVN